MSTEFKTFYHPRKVLDEMTNLTTSFIIDDNHLNKSDFNINEIQKYQQSSNKFSIFDFEKLKFLGKGNFG